jgi:hypothetical protein
MTLHCYQIRLQGMHLLVAKFLNLVTGQHVNSKKFWIGEVTVGVVQRFGAIAITEDERSNLLHNCSASQVHSSLTNTARSTCC